MYLLKLMMYLIGSAEKLDMASTDNSNPSVGEGLSSDIFIPYPPCEDWELNILLDDIAQGITEEDLMRLKSYFIGNKKI